MPPISWFQALRLLLPLAGAAVLARGGAGDGAPSAASEAADAAELVARIRGGDRAAEAELVARFSRGLLLMLRQLARNPALAEDLHQETLALVLEKLRRGDIQEPERLAGFIRGTARNLFLADRRKEARYRPLDGGDAGDDAEERPENVLADGGPAPLDRVLAGEDARRVERLLAELRFDRDRQLLLRFYLSEDGKEEICAALEIAPERFNVTLFRARERLRELWEREEKRRRFFTGAERFMARIGGDPAPRR